MCGIVGAVAERNVVPILMEGLRRLEYRGYDSAGLAIETDDGILRLRRVGKVQELQHALDETPVRGGTGISHTRWATHGVPSESNAHPHLSNESIAVVHNGIIENFQELRDDLKGKGYEFTSDTDTEIIAHRVHFNMQSADSFAAAVRMTVAELEGAYALAVMSADHPGQVLIAREGAPAVIGIAEPIHQLAVQLVPVRLVASRFHDPVGNIKTEPLIFRPGLSVDK